MKLSERSEFRDVAPMGQTLVSYIMLGGAIALLLLCQAWSVLHRIARRILSNRTNADQT